jgi:D-alanine--poly(phosphoribitol) ligase subunit 1
MGIINAIHRWAELAPQHIAHISGDRTLTYGELERRSDVLASHFLREFSSADAYRPVAIYGHKEPELLIGFLAAVKSGHPYVPIDVAIPRHRLDYILSASRALTLLSAMDIATLTEGAPSETIDPSKVVTGEDPFYIMFTSGSTGDPKGVVISCQNLESFVDWMVHEQQFTTQGEVILDQAPFSFDLSVMDVYPCLATGNTLFSLHNKEVANPAQLFRALSRSHVTTWVSTPSFVQMCLVEKSFARAMLPRLERFLFCGETLAVDIAATLLDRFPGTSVWNTYGPTETTVATTSVKIDKTVLKTYAPLPLGYPKAGSQIVIMDEADNRLPEGQRGQIIIAGPNVSAGYLGRQDLTHKAFFDLEGRRAYRTGDQGHIEHGLLFFDGRLDNQIKLHGHRIEIEDVEANLQALPCVRDAVVVVKMKDGVPDSLSAFVIYEDREELSEIERTRLLRRQLGERVPAYLIPRRFYYVSAFPLTVNGKADRKKLAESQL